jgi:hypothetical protein
MIELPLSDIQQFHFHLQIFPNHCPDNSIAGGILPVDMGDGFFRITGCKQSLSVFSLKPLL